MQQHEPTAAERTRVIIFLILGLTAFGFAPIIVRLSGDTNPVALATYRTFLAAIMLFPFWFFKHDNLTERIGEFTNELKLKVISGAALGLHFTLWISSLHYTSVASASVLVTIHPIILIVVESLLFKMAFKKNVWIGVFISFGGSLLLGWSDHSAGGSAHFENPLLGDFIAFGAAAVFVVYFLISRKLRQTTDWLDYVFNVYFYAAITTLIFSFILGIDLAPTPLLIICASALALGPQIIGHGSMNYAVKFVSPTLLSTLILVEPLFATVVAYFLFAEVPGAFNIIAMGVILAGVSLTWSRKARKKPN